MYKALLWLQRIGNGGVGNAVQITNDSENPPEAWQKDRLWRDVIHGIFSPNETFFEPVSGTVREHRTTVLEILGKRNRKEAQFLSTNRFSDSS
jgi:hypothetical protein